MSKGADHRRNDSECFRVSKSRLCTFFTLSILDSSTDFLTLFSLRVRKVTKLESVDTFYHVSI